MLSSVWKVQLVRTLPRLTRPVTLHSGCGGQLALLCCSRPLFEEVSYGTHGLPWWLNSKESACNAADVGLIPGSERSPGKGNGYLRQYSCLGNPTDRGAWRATVHRVAKSWTQLSN